ncbi:fantom protein [Wolffia australiana]
MAGGSWLDKLYKGRALLGESLLLPPPIPSPAPRISPETRDFHGSEEEEGKWAEAVGGALAELFRMDGPDRRGGEKIPRKQPNPRIFVVSAAAERGEVVDLGGFSRTDVTVIDTSSPSWKSQKIILRKGSVWMISEKKIRNASRKKRKLGAAKKSTSPIL